MSRQANGMPLLLLAFEWKILERLGNQQSAANLRQDTDFTKSTATSYGDNILIENDHILLETQLAD